MLRDLGRVRHAVRLGILFLFRKVGDFVLSLHMISTSGLCLDRRTAKCERGDSNPHGLLHWILSPARLPNSATSALTIQKDSNPRHRFLRAAQKKSPRQLRGGLSQPAFELSLYLPTCRFTILGACVASASEKTRRLTYWPFFNRPSACWRSAGVLMARAGAGYRTSVMTSFL